MGEIEIVSLLCAFLGGAEVETRHYFDVNGQSRHVRVDCETATHVIEVGLDGTQSSRDSIHQAFFAAEITGKQPAIVDIDRDGLEGKYEYETRIVANSLGLRFTRCKLDFVVSWAATSGLRSAGLDKTLDDLPKETVVQSRCDLTGLNGDI